MHTYNKDIFYKFKPEQYDSILKWFVDNKYTHFIQSNSLIGDSIESIEDYIKHKEKSSFTYDVIVYRKSCINWKSIQGGRKNWCIEFSTSTSDAILMIYVSEDKLTDLIRTFNLLEK